MGAAGGGGQFGGGAAQLGHQGIEIVHGLRQRAARLLQAPQRAGNRVQVGVAQQQRGALRHGTGRRHQLRQTRQEHIEARRRRADHGEPQARDHRRHGLVAAVLEQVDVQQPGDSLQLQLRDGMRRYRRGGIDVDDHLDAAGIARVDVHVDHAADTDAEVTHRRAPLETADAAAEVDLVAVVVAVLAGVGIPVDEQRSQQRHQQHERADRGVVRFTFHVRLPGARARARRGNRP